MEKLEPKKYADFIQSMSSENINKLQVKMICTHACTEGQTHSIECHCRKGEGNPLGLHPLRT